MNTGSLLSVEQVLNVTKIYSRFHLKPAIAKHSQFVMATLKWFKPKLKADAQSMTKSK